LLFLKVLIHLVVSFQVLKHQSVEHVDHVDLDDDVIKTCEQYFPQWGDAWKDPRASLHICDGAQFVRDAADGTYDVIIQDSSDPFVVGDDGVMKPLPSEALYEKNHICELHRILKHNGILSIQVRGVMIAYKSMLVLVRLIFLCSVYRENLSMFPHRSEKSLPGGKIWKHVVSRKQGMATS
jgi:spermidine synthase